MRQRWFQKIIRFDSEKMFYPLIENGFLFLSTHPKNKSYDHNETDTILQQFLHRIYLHCNKSSNSLSYYIPARYYLNNGYLLIVYVLDIFRGNSPICSTNWITQITLWQKLAQREVQVRSIILQMYQMCTIQPVGQISCACSHHAWAILVRCSEDVRASHMCPILGRFAPIYQEEN